MTVLTASSRRLAAAAVVLPILGGLLTAAPASAQDAEVECGPSTVTLERTTISAMERAPLTVRTTPNTTVDLFAYTRPSSTYRLVRSADVGEDGLASFEVRPPANTRLYAQQRDCTPTEPPASVVLNVRTTLSLFAGRNGTRDYIFSGDSLPARAGGLIVTLYRVTADGRQIIAAQTRANALDGEWSIQRHFTGSGRFGFVVRTGQDMQNAPGSSNMRSLLVY